MAMAKVALCVSAALVVLWMSGHLWTFSYIILYTAVIVVSAYYGAASVLFKGPKYQVIKSPRNTNKSADAFMNASIQQQHFKPCTHQIVTSRNLDRAIQDLLSLIRQDYILPWYTEVAWNQHTFSHFVEDDAWYLVREFSTRLQKIDWVTFMARDVMNALTRHFHTIRTAKREGNDSEGSLATGQAFTLHPWQATEETEKEFLRKVAKTFLHYLLPKTYTKKNPATQVLQEILASSVFKSGIDIICDPDYVNEKIINWLGYKEQIALEHARKYTYAATYEEFIQMIEKSNDIDHLKQIRYNIISEIMQATTIQNLKRAQGLDTNKESSPKGTTKGDLLKARNLKRYLNQLSVTKSFCEKRLQSLGGPDYLNHEEQTEDKEHLPGKMVLSFQVVMETPSARQHFLKYLQHVNKAEYLRFWTDIESMKLSGKHHWHQMATEIYQTHVAAAGSDVKQAIGRNIVKNMETFMKGNSGPEAFWSAQDVIRQVLEEKHYASFILSDTFHQYIITSESHQNSHSQEYASHESSTDGLDVRSPGRCLTFHEDLTSSTRRISEHSTYAQEKLEQLQEKISNKKQALAALLRSQAPDPKIQRLAGEMRDEIETLTREHQQLVFHIDRTDLWAVNIGKWRASIDSVQCVEEDETQVAVFIVIVHQQDIVPSVDSFPDTQGWVISRQIEDFHALHKELVQMDPTFRKERLPPLGKHRSKSLDKEFLQKSLSCLQEYVDRIMGHDRLSQCEAVFAFFSPSPHHLKVSTDTKSRGSLSFSSLFKNLSNKSHDSDSDDEQFFSSDKSTKNKESNDWIAEPLYLLIGELFELRGVFKWLRRSLMLFVQVTFGRSINRQIREMVRWIHSEPMLIFYLNSFREAYWPNGKLAEKVAPRTDQDKTKSRQIARTKFLNNIPDALKNLVGDGNAQRGAIKMFEFLQDAQLNKHLFYVLLQLFLYEVFPELKEYQKKDQERRKQEDAAKRKASRTSETSDSETDTSQKKVRHRRKPNIPVTRLHNSSAFWMSI